jgi:5'-3' exonuclease
VVITADNDLWQIIDDRISLWNPKDKAFYGREEFRDEWGLEPLQWVEVKSLAGCKSDTVEGIRGIGYSSAAKYLRGDLKGKKLELIQSNPDIPKSILKLVKLPFPEPIIQEVVSDSFSIKQFEGIFNKYDFKFFLRADEFRKWRNIFVRGEI